MRTPCLAAMLAILAITPHRAAAQSGPAPADPVQTVEIERMAEKPKLLNPDDIGLRIARTHPRLEDVQAGGSTTLLLVIGEDGRPRSVDVATSSGRPGLDRLLANVWRGARFSPPRLDGRPVRVRTLLPVSLGYTPASPPAVTVTPR
ncbi:MAG TPA: TonB family protein [Longimicrobium sp.]|nr:TonB family protein [Longimicrobium sp.]